MRTTTTRLATLATLVGLGGLAGVALGSNQTPPQQTVGPQGVQASGSQPRPVMTGASATAPVSQVTSAPAAGRTQPPIVTRSSGGAAPGAIAEDDYGEQDD